MSTTLTLPRKVYTGMGASPHEAGVAFRVWAPNAQKISLRLLPAHGESKVIELQRGLVTDRDTWEALVEARPGDRYYYVVDGRQVPDPVSRLLPEGIHGPTEIVDPLRETPGRMAIA